MGCHTITHKGQQIFIPECMGAAVWGKERCTCYTHRKQKLTPAELIEDLKREIKELKKENKLLRNQL